MTSAFANGLRMVGNRRIQLSKKPVTTMPPQTTQVDNRIIQLSKKPVTTMPPQTTQPVTPPISPMTVPGQTVQQQVPAVTPQIGVQGSLVKDVLRRKRMLEI